MNKSNFFSLSFLFGTAALFLPGMAQECRAQADFDNCLPPKVIHHFGFEDAVKDDFADDTLTIDGRRWRFHNARIVSDSILGIPEGRKAVQIRAGEPDGEPACLQLLDTIHGAGLTFQIVHSGIDRLINRSRCWNLEASMDGGQTWAQATPAFDSRCEFAWQSVTVPVLPDSGYVFRFDFHNPDNNMGSDWSILIDGIRVTEGDYAEIPWYVQPGNITNGFSTASDSISFRPVLSGSSYFFGDEEYGGRTSVYVKVDNGEPQVFNTMPLDLSITLRHLSQGKHHLNIRFYDRKLGRFLDEAQPTDIDFYVRPYEQIQGIGNLLKATPGKFYELTPQQGHDILVNWASPTRAQRWLYDGTGGILVDDPQFLDPVRQYVPDNMMHVKKIRGQLVKVSNNLMLRLDTKADIDTLNTKFMFTNYRCDDLSTITDDPEAYMGTPLCLAKVKLSSDNGVVRCLPNEFINATDAQGNTMRLENIFTDMFTMTSLAQADSIMVFGIVGKSFTDGPPVLFPLSSADSPSTGISPVADKGQKVGFHTFKGGMTIQPTRQRVCLATLSGIVVFQAESLQQSHSLSLPAGIYLLNGKKIVVN